VQVHALEGKGIQNQRNGEQAANRRTKYLRDTSVVLGHFSIAPIHPGSSAFLVRTLCRTMAAAEVMAITKWSIALKPGAGVCSGLNRYPGTAGRHKYFDSQHPFFVSRGTRTACVHFPSELKRDRGDLHADFREETKKEGNTKSRESRLREPRVR
jgi:hypothetical protein